MHKLGDEQLRGLILEETGQGEDSSAVQLVLTAIKYIKKFADFNLSNDSLASSVSLLPKQEEIRERKSSNDSPGQAFGMNLSYTINLNLPATADIAVFNAIFKSLKENLLANE